jgi:hypothetical protein
MATVQLDGSTAIKPSQSGAEPPVDGQDQGQRRKSTNPFRQYQVGPGTAIPRSIRSLSQDTESSASGKRKNAPPRAVFFDLPTAHSSITSGAARTKGRETPSNVLDTSEDENSFQLHELDPATRPTDFVKNAPLPPMPAVLPSSRYGDSPADCISAGSGRNGPNERGKLISPKQPEARSGPGGMLHSLKSVLVSISSPITAKDSPRALTSTQWLQSDQDVSEKRPGADRRRNHRVEDNFVSVVHTPHCTAQTLNSRDALRRGSSDGYSGDLSSIYHSSLGQAHSGSLPSSSRENDSGGNASHKPNHAARRQAFGYYSSASRFEIIPSTPDDGDDVLPLPRQLREPGNQSNDGSSLPDGSTVGNIYKHYQGSLSGDEQSEFDHPCLDKAKGKQIESLLLQKQTLSSTLKAQNQLRPSTLMVRQQTREGKVSVTVQSQPPKFGLPDVPKSTVQHFIHSSSQGLAQSSSYGDTNQLLEISQRGHWTGIRPAVSRSAGTSDQRSKITVPEFGDSSPPTLPSNNPFRGSTGPQLIVSEATDNNSTGNHGYNYATADREPLEREVSNALRRVSAISAYSDESISSPLRYTDYQSDLPSSDSIACLRRQVLDDNPSSKSGSGNGNHQGIAAGQVQAFYNQGAIAPGWVNNQQTYGIRIPINRKGFFPSSPPDSPPKTTALVASTQVQSATQTLDDVNDWETVGESALGGYKSSGATDGMLGGTVNRAGSSIANTSDEGSGSSRVPDMEDYGSTERFVQHPGPIEYHNDYRLRDLKETRTPIFLPKFREHNVNGYLADSNRTRPPVNLFSYNPRPLDDHTNPFSSPPPERMPTQKAKPSQSPRHYRAPSPMPFTTPTSNTTESVATENNSADMAGPSCIIRRSQVNPNWMDDFGDPGPAISTPKQRNHNSYDHVMILAKGGTIAGYNPDGTRIGGSSDMINVNDGFVETGVNGGLKNSRDRTLLVRGPPGAFYRGVQQRSRGESCRIGGKYKDVESTVIPHPRKRAAKQLPTNRLRPLSMLNSTPITAEGNEANKPFHSDDFIYRSPLGPPKRKSTHLLYKQSELDKFKNIAINARSGIRLSSSKDSGFQRQLFEAPRLYRNPSDAEARSDPYEQKRNVSINALCLCNLFPPLLGLYAIGRLDGIAEWWTDGEITKFGKGEKRYAYIMATCWAMLTLVGLITFLIYVSDMCI